MTDKMKASFLYGPNDLRIEETDVPELKKHEVLIKVHANGVCPSGLSSVRRGQQWGPPGTRIPGVPGHEFAGEVVKLGPEVEGISVGDRVAPNALMDCGHCHYCRIGRSNFCEHPNFLPYFGYAHFVKAMDHVAYKIPKGLSYEEASFAEPLACVLNGIELANIRPASDVLIIGAGPIGLMHLQLAKNVCGARVMVSDLIEKRLVVAKNLGADEVINPSKEDIAPRVKELTENRGADSVIVAVSNTIVQAQALDLVGKCGTVEYFAGIHQKEPPQIQINPNTIHYGEVNLTGAHNKTDLQFRQALKLLGTGHVKTKPLISHRLPLDRIMEGMDIVEKRQGLKVIIQPNK